MKYIVVLLLSLLTFVGCGEPKPVIDNTWAYEGHKGPKAWGEFSPVCMDGKQQSPINIISYETDSISSENLLFVNYESKVHLEQTDTKRFFEFKVSGENTITIKGFHYKLLSIGLHHKAEHSVDGKKADMELQFLHKSPQGNYAMIAVAVKEGKSHDSFEYIKDKLAKNSIYLKPADLLPESMVKYFFYEGSLTSPPCREEIKWYVVKDSISMSKKQIAFFSKNGAVSSRKQQELHGRYIEAK